MIVYACPTAPPAMKNRHPIIELQSLILNYLVIKLIVIAKEINLIKLITKMFDLFLNEQLLMNAELIFI